MNLSARVMVISRQILDCLLTVLILHRQQRRMDLSLCLILNRANGHL
nr:MAG TPA: hypothetical protein [Caudoviricetes sp.]